MSTDLKYQQYMIHFKKKNHVHYENLHWNKGYAYLSILRRKIDILTVK